MDPATSDLLLACVVPHIQKSSKGRPTEHGWAFVCRTLLPSNWRCTVYYSFKLSDKSYHLMLHCEGNKLSAMEYFSWKRLSRQQEFQNKFQKDSKINGIFCTG